MNRQPHVPDYQVTGVAGAGSGQGVWSARAVSGERVVLRIVRPASPLERQRLEHRWRGLGSVETNGVARAIDCLDLPGGEVAAVSEHVDGPTLGTLQTARQGLTAPECLALARRLLLTLAAMHAAGLVHGDVAPSNVVLPPEGENAATVRPVLVDVAPLPARERGTPGFTAPEIGRGAPLSAPADVYAVGALAVDVASRGDRSQVRRELEDLLRDDPQRRPSARDAARLLSSHQTPVPAAEARLLAAATLRSHAARTRTTFSPALVAVGRAIAADACARALIVVAALAVAGALMASEMGGQPGSDRRLAALPTPTEHIANRVLELTALRDRALESGDHELLAEVSVPGSAAAESDTAVLGGLEEAGVEIVGLTSRVGAVEVLEIGNGAARVQLEVAQGSYQRHAPDGVAETVGGTHARCATMDLEQVSGAWRVADVGGCSTS